MKYSTFRSFEGNRVQALDESEAIFLPIGFSLKNRTDQSIQWRGGGFNSTREDPVKGASEIKIEIQNDEIHLEASLTGVFFMMLFVMIMPVAYLGSSLISLFSEPGLEGFVFSMKHWGGVSVFLILGSMFSYWLRQRTVTALEDVLDHVVARSGPKS